MAFFDFMNQGIRGMTPAQTAPGVAGEGDIVTQQPQPIGPTWGDLTKAAALYGSKPGSSTPAIASMQPWSSQQQMKPIGPTNLMQTPQDKKSGDSSDLAEIAQILTAIFGGIV